MMKIESLNDYPQFIEVVAGWIYKEFIENIRQGITYEMIVNNFSSMKKDAIPCTLVAVENDICLGTVSLFANDLKERSDLTPWLASLYIKEEYRNRGIAKELMGEISIIAKELGYNGIYLRTEHTSEYYRKLGWQLIYKTTDEYNLETEVFFQQF